MDWTEDTIARLRNLWDEGHTTAEIGRRLGVTKNAVVGKAHRLSLPARPSPIRRGSAEGRAALRPALRRTSGPTLPALQAMVPSRPDLARPDLARPQLPRTEPSRAELARPAAALRPVPATPRTAARSVSCCWPIGEPGTPAFRFCSDVALAGKPYCGEHAEIAYVKVRDRRADAA